MNSISALKKTDYFSLTKEFAGDFFVSYLTSLFLETAYAGSTTLPSTILVGSTLFSYKLFKSREEFYKLCILAKETLNDKYDKKLFDRVNGVIRRELQESIGQKWLEVKSLSLEEGVQHLSEVCLGNGGTCDGETLSFLNVINQSQAASLKDLKLEDKINHLDSIRYQVMRELKVGVRNSFIGHFGKEPLIDACDQYDPYSKFESFLLYRQMAGKLAFDIVFDEVRKLSQNLLDNQEAVLVGRVRLLHSSGEPGHAFAVQFNFGHYRYRDALIRSHKSLEEMLQGLHQHLSKYLEKYDQIEFTLWNLPSSPDQQR